MTPLRRGTACFLLSACWLLLHAAPAPGAQPESARLVIDAARSEVRFYLRAPRHDVVGRSQSLSGAVEIAARSLSGASEGHARVPVRSLKTGNKRRDRVMRGILEADAHPDVSFVADSFEADPGEGLGDGRWRGVVHGTLRVRGVSRAVDFRITGRVEEDGLHARGSGAFPLTYFGIDPPRFLRFLKVRDHVRVEFDVVAVPAAGPL
ncbi:MAG: YceI family protein [Myxococcota bacterium]